MNYYTKKLTAIFLAAAVIVFIFSGITQAGISGERFNMSYVYFGNSSAYTALVDRTKQSLNEISPNYFDINDDGSLKLTPAFSRSFVNEMHSRGIKVVPFLSNHWDREKGRAAIVNGQLADQLVNAVVEYNLDGIHVDIENLTEADRENHTLFIKSLREKLPSGKTLAIAAAANPWGATTGWQGSYDYAALSQYCDYIMIMTYDEHYQGSAPGPVASYSFAEDSVKQALKYIPKEKLVLGIAFYGRYWINGSSYGGYGISNCDIESLISAYNGTVVFDAASGSPRATVTIPAGSEPYISGKMLAAGTYTFWYENEASIKLKLKLVQEYDIKGTGSWSLGQEAANTWDYYKLWLNGKYFSDLAGHWAEASILTAIDEGWMVGVSSSSFRPDGTLTRAEAAATLVRALDPGDWTGERTFKDLDGHWGQAEIEAAAQYGIVQGTGNGYFSPDEAVTREQLAAMLDRALDLEKGVSNPFPDVSREVNYWSYDSILTLARCGLISGYPDGGFHPVAPMTRGQLAAVLVRASDGGYLYYSGK